MPEAAQDNWQPVWNAQVSISTPVPCDIVHCSAAPIIVYMTGFGCALFWCWVSLGAPFTISLIEFYFITIFIMIVVTIIGILWSFFTFVAK